MASATRIPSTAALTIPPAYPAPVPSGLQTNRWEPLRRLKCSTRQSRVSAKVFAPQKRLYALSRAPPAAGPRRRGRSSLGDGLGHPDTIHRGGHNSARIPGPCPQRFASKPLGALWAIKMLDTAKPCLRQGFCSAKTLVRAVARPTCGGAPAKGPVIPWRWPRPPGYHPPRRTQFRPHIRPLRRRGRAPGGRTGGSRPGGCAPARRSGSPLR